MSKKFFDRNFYSYDLLFLNDIKDYGWSTEPFIFDSLRKIFNF